MARHLMAVCVVCILCAKHVPCKEHFETFKKDYLEKRETIGFGNNNSSQNAFSNLPLSLPPELVKETNNINVDSISKKNIQYNKRRARTKLHETDKNEILSRNKRHVTEQNNDFLKLYQQYDHNYQQQTTTGAFLKKLFEQFGNEDGITMNVAGFERMLRRLGLYNLIEERIPKNDDGNLLKSHHSSSFSSSSNESCISSLELISRISPNMQQLNQQQVSSNDDQKRKLSDQRQLKKVIMSNNNENDNRSSSSKNEQSHEHDLNYHNNHQQQQQYHNTIDETDVLLDSRDLFSICPILLYQLTAPTSLERSGCINSSLIPFRVYLSEEMKEDRFYVWLYAISSILGVSLVGLLGVAVIPCMDRHIYQHIIQFLVALAVGTLAGDALLHLLPHSMMTFSYENNGHESMVWKGLVAVLGIIFFFATERGLTMIAEWRKKIEKKEKPSSRVRVMRDPDSTSINNSIAGDKLCKHKYSSYPYCYDEIAMDTKDDHHHHHHHQDTSNQKNSSEKVTTTPVSGGGGGGGVVCNKNSIHMYRDSNDHGDNNETAQSLLSHNYTTISDSYSVMNKEDGNNPDNNTISTNLDDTSIEGGGVGVKDKPIMKEETFTIILREHESSHHGHSHKHGHVHSPPRTLSAVAWMVVMGDGLHNFTDGMAIGAAFSNNIAGGFSTAIAVFCHELPHELGDFAVLLKAGMSAKQAVYYNLLSSVLSFLGMILGVFIGDTPEASAWIFACAAGMFIYIALVDMMPELTSTHNEKCALSQCILQLLGMSSGLGLMLLIALYEHDLKNIFTTSSSHHDHDHHQHNHFH